MPRVTLPEGAKGVAADGRYTARPGDQVSVSPAHAAAIERFRRSGPSRGEAFALGTKGGRLCTSCRRLWNAWNELCPRCGAKTISDAADVSETRAAEC